jgi:hypothetical protein
MALIGTETALRDIWYGRVWRAIGARVVGADGDVTALWMPKGSPSMYPVDAAGAEVRIPVREPVLAERRSSRDALALERPGSRHSIWLFWLDGTFDYWYVNFERTLGWNGVCFDMVDEKLDLIVRPNGALLWKDEDELEHAASLGLVDADEVRAEAANVVAEWPFPTGWESFSPHADWSKPRLPRGWQSVGQVSPGLRMG